MSHAEQGAARHRSWRVLVVGIGVGIAGCALSLLMQTSSASAAEPAEDGSGVLGLVGTTLSTVGSVADEALALTDAVPVPEPIAQLVAPAAAVVESVDRTVVQVAGGVTDTVSGVAGAGITTGVVDLLGSVPVVGTVTDGLGLTETLTGVTEPVDALLADVVGSTTLSPDGVIPSLEVPSGTVDVIGILRLVVVPAAAALGAPLASLSDPSALPSAMPSAPAILLTGGVAAAVVLALTTPLGSPLPQNRGSTSSGSVFSGAQGQTTIGALLRAVAPVPRASARTSRVSDDALPGAPVFDTDTSPD